MSTETTTKSPDAAQTAPAPTTSPASSPQATSSIDMSALGTAGLIGFAGAGAARLVTHTALPYMGSKLGWLGSRISATPIAGSIYRGFGAAASYVSAAFATPAGWTGAMGKVFGFTSAAAAAPLALGVGATATGWWNGDQKTADFGVDTLANTGQGALGGVIAGGVTGLVLGAVRGTGALATAATGARFLGLAGAATLGAYGLATYSQRASDPNYNYDLGKLLVPTTPPTPVVGPVNDPAAMPSRQ